MATYNFVEATGLIVPDVSDLLDTVNAEYRAIFGNEFVVDPETPEGALIASEVGARQSVAINNVTVANQINPNLAGGPFLDAIWALTGGARNAATRSTVQVTITGVAGTLIPQGVVARTTDNIDFRSTVSVTIPVSGTTTTTFESVDTGPVAAGANTLTSIVDGVIGWETINNAAAATLGSNQESDAASRQRRRNTLALQGRSTAEAVTSNVSAVSGVRSIAFRENTTNATDTIDGIVLVAHSIWLAVQGGSDIDVATAILESKSAGANWNGTESVNVVEPASGQTFTVNFDRPTDVAVRARVTIQAGSTLPTDPQLAVRQAVLDYANGNIENEQGFVIGADVSPFELAGAIGREVPQVFVTSVEVAFEAMTPAYGFTPLAIALNQIATIEEAAIEVITS